jgi:hypothetical protein
MGLGMHRALPIPSDITKQGDKACGQAADKRGANGHRTLLHQGENKSGLK